MFGMLNVWITCMFSTYASQASTWCDTYSCSYICSEVQAVLLCVSGIYMASLHAWRSDVL